MENNLAIDIGNSRIKYGIFGGDKLLSQGIWQELTMDAVKRLSAEYGIRRVIISSVRDILPDLEKRFKANFNCIILSHETPLPFEMNYKTPQTLGKDRVAAVAGACHLFPGQNCLVIDAGTCITMDILDAGAAFQGGNISPGIGLRLKAMHHFTAKLPLVDRSVNNYPDISWLGDSTESAIRNGAEWGALMEMTSFIQKCRREYRPLRVILTGGDADFFGKTLKTKIFVFPNLVLTGLNKILTHNVQKLRGKIEIRGDDKTV